MIERASQDNAIKRALKLEATKVSTVLDQMIPTNFVIVRCPRTGFLYLSIMWVSKVMLMFCFFFLKSDADPIMVAEVCSVDVENKSLCVHWWTPTSLSRQKQQLFHNMTFAPEMDKIQLKNRIRAHPCGD